MEVLSYGGASGIQHHQLVLEQRAGMRLDRLWHDLSEGERAHIQSDCLNGIHALRQVGFRLDDSGGAEGYGIAPGYKLFQGHEVDEGLGRSFTSIRLR